MTTAIATLITRAPRSIGELRLFNEGVLLPYRPLGLAAFDSENRLTAQYPRDTKLDVALASAKYEDTGAHEDLVSLLKLEARDGNDDAAAVLARHESPNE